MRILSISYSDIWPWGKNKGIPSVFFPQKGFVDKGHEVFFLCTVNGDNISLDENNSGINIRRFRLPFGLNFNHVNSLPLNPITKRIKASFLSNLCWYLFQVYCFIYARNLAKNIKPDIIYVHGLTPAFCGYLISKMFKAKLILRVYGAKDLYYKQNNFFYRIKEFRNYLAFKVPADHFIITNDGTKADVLAKQRGVSEEKIKCWRNGIDFKDNDRDKVSKKDLLKKLNLPLDTKLIVSTCRPIPIYRMNITLKIMIKVLEKDKKAVFVIAGEGIQLNLLKEIANKSNVKDRILFLGNVKRNMIEELLIASDVFVFIPKYHNCTNTMWEAMICGCAIVTTKTEQINDILIDQEEAILMQEEDIENTPEIIVNLLNNDELRKKLSENVIAKSASVLESWPKRVEKEIRLLEELIAK